MVMYLSRLNKLFNPAKSSFQYYHSAIEVACAYADITTKPQIALFIANTSHETRRYEVFRENLFYTAERMAVVWPGRFRGPDGKPNALAKKLSRKPDQLANHVYSGKLGNGDVESGDGWLYRGRGLPMLTGRDWYTKMDQEFNMNGKIIEIPHLLEQMYWSAMAGGFFWKARGVGKFADQIGKSIDKTTGYDAAIVKARKAWQGGSLGLKEVNDMYGKIIKLL
jgi:putative chitinase